MLMVELFESTSNCHLHHQPAARARGHGIIGKSLCRSIVAASVWPIADRLSPTFRSTLSCPSSFDRLCSPQQFTYHASMHDPNFPRGLDIKPLQIPTDQRELEGQTAAIAQYGIAGRVW